MKKSTTFLFTVVSFFMIVFFFNLSKLREYKQLHHDHLIFLDTLQIELNGLKNEIDTLKIEMHLFNQTNPQYEEGLLEAMIQVESNGDSTAYCKSEDAVGILQIRRTMVRDINRILDKWGKSNRYTYEDRWDTDKSIEMFQIYCQYYNLTKPEAIARCWNGGPDGIYELNTVAYWKKVKAQLDS
jgi:hypothetical protein